MSKKPFATEAEEEAYHLEMHRELMQKLLTLAKEEPELANQLLRQLMFSAELLVTNIPNLKEDLRNLVKDVDAEIRTSVKIPVGRAPVSDQDEAAEPAEK